MTENEQLVVVTPEVPLGRVMFMNPVDYSIFRPMVPMDPPESEQEKRIILHDLYRTLGFLPRAIVPFADCPYPLRDTRPPKTSSASGAAIVGVLAICAAVLVVAAGLIL